MAAKNELSGKDLCIEVKNGDNVWSLAEKVYGPGHAHLAAIYEENHMSPQITARNGKRAFVAPVIKPGDKLFFPTPERVHQLEHEFFSKAGKPDEPKLAPRAESGLPPEAQALAPTGVLKAPVEQPNLPPKTTTTMDKPGLPLTDNHAPHSPPALKPASATADAFPVPTVTPTAAAETAQPATKIDNATRAAHVAEVCADGLIVGTLREGIKQSCEDPLGTAARVGTAVALGTAFGVATGGVGFAAEAIGAVGVGLTVAGAWDFLNPFDKRNAERNQNIASCAARAWNAQDRPAVEGCYTTMERELGRPGLDIGLGIIGGAAGAKFGRAFIRPHILAPTPGVAETSTSTLKQLPGPGSHDVDAEVRIIETPQSITTNHGSPKSLQTAHGGKLALETSHGGPMILETTYGGPKRLETTMGSPKLLEDHEARAKVAAAEADAEAATTPPLPAIESSVSDANAPNDGPNDELSRQRSIWENHKRKLTGK